VTPSLVALGRIRGRRTDMVVKATTMYRLADEPRAVFLFACHKCEWRAAFSAVS
jgi:hypothetical protein